jgi:dienelactone hydrolase
MSDPEKFYANLANEAYKRKDRKREYEGYIHDDLISDTRHAIYHNAEKNHTVLSVRGTRTDLSQDSIEDLVDSDLGGIVFSDITATRRYKQAQEKLKQAQQKYKGSRVDLTGHSLGGRVVEELAAREKNVNESHSFNPGSFVQNALKDVECKYSMSRQCKNRKQRIHRYTVEGDLLSIASHSGQGIKQHTHKKKPKKGLDAHTIRNFID